MIFVVTLLLVQCILLASILVLAGSGSRGLLLYRLLNPLGFMTFFYLLFFITPQIYGIFNDYFLVGFPRLDSVALKNVYLTTQSFLLLFLFFILLGVLTIGTYYPQMVRPQRSPEFLDDITRRDMVILAVFFAIGTVALSYLAQKSGTLQGFRSELVKTTDGKIATALSFYANFSFSVFLFLLLRNKKFLWALVLFVCFGTLIAFTGARGRLLWPTLLAFATVMAAKNRIKYSTVLLSMFGLIIVLSILDSLRVGLLTGHWEPFNFAEQIQLLFEKRTFDGFSNFSLILLEDQVPKTLAYVFQGARLPFMETYFIDTYIAGVGFGSTVPGWFYLCGGVGVLCILSFFYGAFLMLLGVWLRNARSFWTVFGFYFAAVWLCAVGGNFVESLQKMAIAASPGLVGYTLQRVRFQIRIDHTKPPAFDKLGLRHPLDHREP